MCTAITYKVKNSYFGRNLDVEFPYEKKVIFTPRKYKFSFSNGQVSANHHSIIGMGCVKNDYPLYYEGTNEKGLSMAGLSFSGNAYYGGEIYGKENISPYELLPWVLSLCSNIIEAKELLQKVNLINTPFSKDLPLSDLHWLLADREEAIVLEATIEGIKIYNNPVGVLTNNPPFYYHLENLNSYMGLSNRAPINLISDKLDLNTYSRGMGSLGLPGDYTSISRFIKATFVKYNSVCECNEHSAVNQFFHILDSVCQQRGCVMVEDKYEITEYTSCCNVDLGIYYWKTYKCNQINAVDIRKENNDSHILKCYTADNKEEINFLN